jgi:DNA-binding FrmR family transcriptional regulator
MPAGPWAAASRLAFAAMDGKDRVSVRTTGLMKLLIDEIRPCIPYPMGVYRVHGDRHESFLREASQSDRGSGPQLARMIEEDRYCIDVVTQIAAVRAASRRLEEEILRVHVAHCVEHALASGNKADQRRKLDERMAVVGRADR